MDTPDQQHLITPGHFQLAELNTLQSYENKVLADVWYYFRISRNQEGNLSRFLYFLELIFDSAASLNFSSGEDTDSLEIVNAETVVQTALDLQAAHGETSIQRAHAGAYPLWESLIGTPLEGARLSKDENGLYFNDAVLLDFGPRRVLVSLSEREGLALGKM